MHEEAVLQDLVAKVDEIARGLPGGRVRRVRLWIGALSHVPGGQLKARWAQAAAGTAGEFAEVEVVESPDPEDARAQQVVLVSVDVADA
jgi:hydrogenase nickel incorporation protein HypA/HybF